MPNVNIVTLMGHSGQDAEIRTLSNGNKVATFTLATSKGGFTTRDGKEIPAVTQWHNIVCWRHLADICEKSVRKGSHVTVIGELTYRKYTDKNGEERSKCEIVAEELMVAKMKETAVQPQTAEKPAEQQPTYRTLPSYQAAPPQPAPINDGDLPF